MSNLWKSVFLNGKDLSKSNEITSPAVGPLHRVERPGHRSTVDCVEAPRKVQRMREGWKAANKRRKQEEQGNQRNAGGLTLRHTQVLSKWELGRTNPSPPKQH